MGLQCFNKKKRRNAKCARLAEPQARNDDCIENWWAPDGTDCGDREVSGINQEKNVQRVVKRFGWISCTLSVLFVSQPNIYLDETREKLIVGLQWVGRVTKRSR